VTSLKENTLAALPTSATTGTSCELARTLRRDATSTAGLRKNVGNIFAVRRCAHEDERAEMNKEFLGNLDTIYYAAV